MMKEGFRLKKVSGQNNPIAKNSKDHIIYKINMMKGLLEQMIVAMCWSEEFLRISFVLDIQPMA